MLISGGKRQKEQKRWAMLGKFWEQGWQFDKKLKNIENILKRWPKKNQDEGERAECVGLETHSMKVLNNYFCSVQAKMPTHSENMLFYCTGVC